MVVLRVLGICFRLAGEFDWKQIAKSHRVECLKQWSFWRAFEGQMRWNCSLVLFRKIFKYLHKQLKILKALNKSGFSLNFWSIIMSELIKLKIKLHIFIWFVSLKASLIHDNQNISNQQTIFSIQEQHVDTSIQIKFSPLNLVRQFPAALIFVYFRSKLLQARASELEFNADIPASEFDCWKVFV